MTDRRGGFSLLEAVVATALLALGCSAVAGVVHVSLRAEARQAGGRAAVELLAAEGARLEALPYFRPVAGPGLGPASLLAELFPHARPALNSPAATYDAGTGEFTTRDEVATLRVARIARFARQTGDGLEPLPPGIASGWAVWAAAQPPAVVLCVRVEVGGHGSRTVTRELVFSGLPPAPPGALAGRGGAPRDT